MIRPTSRYPREFREAELSRVFRHILSGDSLSIVGIGSIGKSHLVDHITWNQEAQAYLLQVARNAEAETPSPDLELLVVKVDPNAMLDDRRAVRGVPPTWRGYELVLRQLVDSVTSRAIDSASGETRFSQDLIQRLAAHYAAITQPAGLGPRLALRRLEAAVEDILDFWLSQRQDGRIVLIFDEFQHILESLPHSFFLNLRALRDKFKYRLMYITVSRIELTHLVPLVQRAELNFYNSKQRRQRYEPFTELFQEPLYIGLYTRPRDVEIMLAELARRKRRHYADWDWPTGMQSRLLDLAGGHGGLTRTMFDLLEQLPLRNNLKADVDDLMRHEAVVEECRIMRQSFTPSEIDMLAHIAANATWRDDAPPLAFLDGLVFASLQRKHAIMLKDGTWRVVPLLFEAYMSDLFPHERDDDDRAQRVDVNDGRDGPLPYRDRAD